VQVPRCFITALTPFLSSFLTRTPVGVVHVSFELAAKQQCASAYWAIFLVEAEPWLLTEHCWCALYSAWYHVAATLSTFISALQAMGLLQTLNSVVAYSIGINWIFGWPWPKETELTPSWMISGESISF